jgi:hypothetical protein
MIAIANNRDMNVLVVNPSFNKMKVNAAKVTIPVA